VSISSGKHGLTVVGIGDIKKLLDQMDKKHARRISRNTVRAVAAYAAKAAKKNAPTDTGLLKKSVRAKSKKSPPENPMAVVEVRTGSPNKAYYWHFLDRGTKPGKKNGRGITATNFMTNARTETVENLPGIIAVEFEKKVRAAIKKELKAVKK
jgi:HK97 gp10 family phage protein